MSSNRTNKKAGRQGAPRLARVEAVVSPTFSRAVKSYAADKGTTVQALVVVALNNLLENDR